jgi:hypothetical protein
VRGWREPYRGLRARHADSCLSSRLFSKPGPPEGALGSQGYQEQEGRPEVPVQATAAPVAW